jgi:hypothetical protein
VTAPTGSRGRAWEYATKPIPSSRTVGSTASSLDRDRPVDAVLVVEIDVVDAEPPQRRVALADGRAAETTDLPGHGSAIRVG